MNDSQILSYKSLENAILLLYLKIVIAFLCFPEINMFSKDSKGKMQKDTSWYSRGSFPLAINTKMSV